MQLARQTFAALVHGASRLPLWVDPLFVAALCLAVALTVMGSWHADLRVPYLASGDAGATQYMIKTVLEHGWYLRNPDVGAPFGGDMYDFEIPEPSHFLLIRLLGLASVDTFLVYNLFYILSFGTVGLSAWWSLRFCGLSRPLAFAGAFLFCVLPYHFLRQPHLFLAAYFSVPIFAAYALRLALYRAPHIDADLRLCVISVLLLVLAAGGGIYYAFFGCLFLAAGTVFGAVHSRNVEPLRIGIVCIALVVLVIGVSLLPNALYHLSEGGNVLVAQRLPKEAEIYGLRLTQLLLPTTYHRFSWMSAIASNYNSSAPLVNENSNASLGVLGGLGLLVALVASIFAIGSRAPPLAAAGALSVAGVLFATMGGFGSLFAFLVTPSIRGLNRISVFIAFLALFSLLWLVQRFTSSRPKLMIVAAGALMLVGGIDEIPGHPISRASPAFDGRQDVFDRIEAALPRGTAVFELPYAFFPEEGWVAQMFSYDLFEPYLRTHGLRWSFGGMHGRASDIWNEQAATLQGSDLISALAGAGFHAIYIDRLGYKDHGAAVEKSIAAIVGPPAIESAAENIAVYRIPDAFPNRPFVVVGPGRSWQPWTVTAKGDPTGLALGSDPELIVANPGPKVWSTVEFMLQSGKPRHVAIEYEGGNLGDYDLLGALGQKITLRFLASAGVSQLRIRTTNTSASNANSPLRIDELEYGALYNN